VAPPDELGELVASLESDDKPARPPTRARRPSERFRASNTGLGRLAANSSRRPQAIVTAETPSSSLRSHRRGATEVNDQVVESEVGKEDWQGSLAVEDDQLVDWSASEETQAGGPDYDKH
jgi:hypothetical protein